ncbi:MAG: 2-haloacid dehalogenase [Candidatus Eremiobacteraeota bacterium]|jgi:2-haloacid dehalogenase|nr:2-haloacid dehalogenase [Candidatus Eremiobacteraeota bacterium]
MPVAAVVFDLYGTLLDLQAMEGPVADAGVDDPAAFVREWRRKQIEYAFLTSLAQAYQPFDELTVLALEQTCALRGISLDSSQRRRFIDVFREMPAHPDAAPALRTLAARGIPRAVLTNGSPASAEAALMHAGVRELLDDVLSVEAVGAFKPDPRIYALATQRFACPPGEIAFVSANSWDAWGAARFGFRVAWCNRAGGPAESLLPAPEVTLGGLHELEAFLARSG